jgi:hypothetical protein
MAEDRFDGMFLTIAQQSQGVDPLLDNLFSFLRRKTDFFTGATTEMIEDLVLKHVKKHAELTKRDEEEKKKVREREERLKKKRLEEKKKKEEEEARAKAMTSGEDDVLELNADGSFDTAAVTSKPPATTAATVVVPPTAPPIFDKASADELENAPLTEEEEERKKKEEEEDKTPPPPGNGGRTERYVWTQQLSELAVNIPMPAGTKAKMLIVDITNRHLRVSIKGQATPLIDGEFHKRVIVDDSTWTLEDGELVLSLQKENKMEWWKCVLVGDPEINTQKVQPENSKLSDLDGETRQTVEKMMFDQKQKALGLPSSDELQKKDMLANFMKAHPEMDFSKAKFS